MFPIEHNQDFNEPSKIRSAFCLHEIFGDNQMGCICTLARVLSFHQILQNY